MRRLLLDHRVRRHGFGALLLLACATPLVSCGGESRTAGDGSTAATAGDASPGDSLTPLAARDSVASPAAPGSGEPNLAVGPDGRVYLSWIEPVTAPDSGHALRFAVHDGAAWSAPVTIRQGTDFFVNWADFPSLLVAPDGRLVAHWLQRTGKGTYAYGVRMAASRDGGSTWSTPVTPHRDNSDTEHGFVSLWNDGDASAAVWLDGRKFSRAGHDAGNEMMLATTSLGADGTLGPETRLDERTCDCCQTAVATTANGPIVAYRDRSAEEIRDIAVTRRVNGSWTPPAVPNPDNWKIAACPVNGPALAARGNDVALAWFAAPDDSARVQVAFSRDGGATFSAPIRVDEGSPAGRVGIALTADRGALVTWVERVGGDTASVRVRRVTEDGARHGSRTLAVSSAARASGFPRVVVEGSHATFAWTVPGKPSAVHTARVPLTRLP